MTGISDTLARADAGIDAEQKTEDAMHNRVLELQNSPSSLLEMQTSTMRDVRSNCIGKINRAQAFCDVKIKELSDKCSEVDKEADDRCERIMSAAQKEIEAIRESAMNERIRLEGQSEEIEVATRNSLKALRKQIAGAEAFLAEVANTPEDITSGDVD